MFKKFAFLLLLALYAAAGGQAQTVTGSFTASSAACVGTGRCVLALVGTTGSASIVIGGTFVGTASFEQTADNVTWIALTVDPAAGGAGVTSATAGGTWTVNVAALNRIRVRPSAYTSGTITARINLSPAFVRKNVFTTAPTFASMTPTHVFFAGTGGLLSGDADMTFATDTLTVTKIIIPTFAGIGTTAPQSLFHVSSNTADLGTAIVGQSNASADGPDLSLWKSRGTAAVPTVITTADELGVIGFFGYGGAAGYIAGAAIKGISSGTIANSRVPGFLSFWTGTNVQPSVLTERLRIDNAGNVGIGKPDPTEKLEIGTAVVGSKVGSATLLMSLLQDPTYYAKMVPTMSATAALHTVDFDLSVAGAEVTSLRLAGTGSASSPMFQGIGTIPAVATCGTIGTGSKNAAGFITSGTTGVCVSTITFTVAATTGWSCSISNGTTANIIRQTASTATTCEFTGTTVSGDILRYTAMAY